VCVRPQEIIPPSPQRAKYLGDPNSQLSSLTAAAAIVLPAIQNILVIQLISNIG